MKEEHDGIISLTKDGKLNCQLVYPSGSRKVLWYELLGDLSVGDYAAVLAKEKVAKALRALAGERVGEIWDTDEYDNEKCQIVFGYSNYDATATVSAKTAPEGYTIDFIDNRIVVFAWISSSLLTAADVLSDLITKSCVKDENGNVSICLPRQRICSDKGSSVFYKDIPFECEGIKANKIYDAGDNAMMLYWKCMKDTCFAAYSDSLKALGFAAYQSYESNSIDSATYTKDNVLVHVYYLKRLSELRAVVMMDAELPVNACEYKKVCEPALTQVEMEMADCYGCGACYLIRLADGTFIVIDGGYGTEKNAKELYGLMQSQKPDGVDDIVITAWILSHPHMDHYDLYRYFANSDYKDLITVKTFVGQDVTDYLLNIIDNPRRQVDYREWAGYFPGCKYIKAHTGQQFRYPGVTIDMMFTHEDIAPGFLYELNNVTDMAFMVTVNGNESRNDYKFFFINDICGTGGDRLVEMWQDEVKCDVLQLGHHSAGGGSIPLYELTGAKICFLADHRRSYEHGWGMRYATAKWAYENIPTWIKAFEGSYTFRFE